jgi:NTF2 fold immunity protein
MLLHNTETIPQTGGRSIMRTCAWLAAFLAISTLSIAANVASLPQGTDEWVALDKSLQNAKSIHPKNGFVPDESTAIRIGEAVAVAQYGEDKVSQEEPFHAHLKGDLWTVKGTLHPHGVFGGTAVIQLSKTDGKIVFMTHQE